MIPLVYIGFTMLATAIGGAKGFLDNQKNVRMWQEGYNHVMNENNRLSIENEILRKRFGDDGPDNIIKFPGK